ncbi:MAG: hypothetical protein O2931_00590 [Planctomycetota bacterium]|nr:hypothetical protein [Planctomycetota bacterium]MDA1177271.1 hypothetical protein [Planctomycetota bacterium]
MAVLEMNRGFVTRSQCLQQLAGVAILGLLTPFVYGQENLPPATPPDNPLAASFVKQLHAWLDSEGKDVFKEFDWIQTPKHGEITKYRLYVPPNAREGRRFPLLVWLHGYCEGGTDNSKHLVYLNELLFRDAQQLPEMYILAVQTPTGYWPIQESPQRDDPLSVVDDIVDHVLDRHGVDADRVLLSGVSSGGSACWNFACRRPDRFAAICPMATNGGDIGQAQRLVNVGVWCFHSSNDLMPTPDKARTMVDAVLTAGGRAKFTETPPNEAFPHNCWHAAFRDYRAAEWLLDQRRHRTSTVERTLAGAYRTAKLVIGYFQEPVAGRPLWWWSALAALVATAALRSKIVQATHRRSRIKGIERPKRMGHSVG